MSAILVLRRLIIQSEAGAGFIAGNVWKTGGLGATSVL
jgi:hypothetical protein